MPRTRIILHIDLDAFFCEVEKHFTPSLQGKAFAIGARPEQRGVVSSCSYEARQFGVRSAMPMSTAIAKCPGLIIVRQRFDAYRDYSGRVMRLLNDITPLVEPLSIDEAFMDVTGLPGDGASIARNLQQRIRQAVNLPCSIGVASNKLLAKTANNIGKSRPFAGETPCSIEVVPPGREAHYLAHLPIRELYGVGEKTAEKLQEIGIKTIGDLARRPQTRMVTLFGKHGHDLWQRANGIDHRPVEPEQEAKSISKETTFARDISDGDELRRVLRQLAEQVGRRLRNNDLAGTTVKIKLRWSDFTTITRQHSLNQPTNDDHTIIEAALDLFSDHWQGQPVRLIGVGVSNFREQARQLDLWATPDDERDKHLQSTLDDLRERFGDRSIKRGSDL